MNEEQKTQVRNELHIRYQNEVMFENDLEAILETINDITVSLKNLKQNIQKNRIEREMLEFSLQENKLSMDAEELIK